MQEVRDYRDGDHESWLRCRVLAFLHTAYFDDVQTRRPVPSPAGFGLVATEDEQLVGILEVSIDGALATIDTIAVLPETQRRGVGGALLDEACRRARAGGATELDAWTRDDEPTLSWYRSHGFVESSHYLHVYANLYTAKDEPRKAVDRPRSGLSPVIVFSHAPLDTESEMRREFRRVHVCRRFSQSLD